MSAQLMNQNRQALHLCGCNHIAGLWRILSSFSQLIARKLYRKVSTYFVNLAAREIPAKDTTILHLINNPDVATCDAFV